MGRLTIVHGDLFAQDVDALVNAVNCVGVMGAGIAREFRIRFPEMFAAYAQRCRAGALRPGTVHVVPVAIGDRAAHVINVPTKDHWRDPSTLALVELGLAALVDVVNDQDYRSIAMPALGCGLGGLSLHDVMPLMQAAAQRMHAEAELRLVLLPNPREMAMNPHLVAMIRASEDAGLYDVDEFEMPVSTRLEEEPPRLPDALLIEVHHLAMIPVAREDDIFALRDRARAHHYEIEAISEPRVNFPDARGRDAHGGPWRNVDVVTVVPSVDETSLQDVGRELLGSDYAGSLMLTRDDGARYLQPNR